MFTVKVDNLFENELKEYESKCIYDDNILCNNCYKFCYKMCKYYYDKHTT